MRRATVSTPAVLTLAALVLGVLAFAAVAIAVGPGGSSDLAGPGGPAGLDSPGGPSDLAGPDGLAASDGGVDGVGNGREPSLVSVGDAELWPYVAPARSFNRRASSINVVAEADPDRVRRRLLHEEAWNRSEEVWAGENGTEAGNQSDEVWGGSDGAPLDAEVVPWRDAPGGTRYAYVADEGWTAERYQLHRGTYFGSRYHLRAYSVQGGEWTAIQAHDEHWDWFTITHTVDSVEEAQRRVEAGFLGEPGFEVHRVHYANGDTYDANGWTTVVLVALAPLLARRRLRGLVGQLDGLATERTRRRALLAGSLAVLPLAVRFGGVGFERHLAWLSSNTVVAVWYPVLVAGVPLAAYLFGRRLPKLEAGALASLGFGAGLVLDYAYLGVGVLPIPVAVHRVVVVVAVGLVAAGAGLEPDGSTQSEFRWTPWLRVGVTLWTVAVVAGHLV